MNPARATEFPNPLGGNETMKKMITFAALLAAFSMLSGRAWAQSGDTSSGSLAVTATVNSSISMVFDSDATGVTLSAEGSSSPTLAFGNVSAYESLGTHVSRTVNGTTNYTISTPFDVKVTQANSSSGNYTLTAQLASADANDTWKVDSATVTDGSAAQVTATGTYGSDQSHTLYLTIPFTTTDSTAISNTINFVATSN
jgi:hypothetical protein